MKTLICLLALSFVNTFSTFAQSANLFKDLSVGNKFVYDYTTETNTLGTLQTFYEEVIGDTIINNRRYGIVLISETGEKKFERSDSVGLFLFQNGREFAGHRMIPVRSSGNNFVAIDSIYWTPYGGRASSYPTERYFTYMPVKLAQVRRDSSLLLQRTLWDPTYPYQIAWAYKANLGLVGRSGSQVFSVTPSSRSSVAMNLRGYSLRGKITGDTTVPRFSVSVGSQGAYTGQIIRVPIQIRGFGIPKHPFVRVGVKLEYDADLLEAQKMPKARLSGIDTLSLDYTWWYQEFSDSTGFIEFKVKAKADKSISLKVLSVSGWQMSYNFKTIEANISHNVGVSGIITTRQIPAKLNDSELATRSYPNPVSSELNVDIFPEAQGILTIKLFTAQGIELFAIEENINNSVYQNKLNIGDLASGVYFLQARCGNKVKTEKIIKL